MANEHALASWRKSNKLSQEEFAVRVGVSRWMINRIETGDRRPSMELVDRIWKATKGKVKANDFAAVETVE
jgi:transcriptional regulator with XRE-family HTH domain